MGATQPKQFLTLNGMPILMHTLKRLNAGLPNAEIVVALPEEHMDAWVALIDEHDFSVKHTCVKGGEQKFHSVKNALEKCSGELIMVHDGVRPFVSDTTLNAILEKAISAKAVVPVQTMTESVRKGNMDSSESVDRSAYFTVQTPQCFHAEILHKAYNQEYNSLFTDDASVVEKLGEEVKLVEGNSENIKITKPEDLKMANYLLNQMD